MTAPVLATPPPVNPDGGLVIRFDHCPEPLDVNGGSGWTEVLGLQAHVAVTRLLGANQELKAASLYCDTCGATLCVNPSFCEACRRAERKRQAPPKQRPRPTPEVTIEAIRHTVRKRGPGALDEPANRRRLRECDREARAELDRWLHERGGR